MKISKETIKNRLVDKEESETRLRYYSRDLANSLSIITLRDLQKFQREELIEIVLLREKTMYQAQQSFQDSLKKNDREVFKNLLEENRELKDLLMQNNPKIGKMDTEMKKLRTSNTRMRLTIQGLIGKLRREGKWKTSNVF